MKWQLFTKTFAKGLGHDQVLISCLSQPVTFWNPAVLTSDWYSDIIFGSDETWSTNAVNYRHPGVMSTHNLGYERFEMAADLCLIFI